MKKTILLLGILTLVSCRKEEGRTDLPEVVAGKDFELEIMDSVPQSLLDGCGEFLTHDSIKGIAVNYLFVSDLVANGLIRIDGKNIDLQRDSIKSQAIDKDNDIQYFKNDSIELILELKVIEKYDEGSFNQGVLTVIKNRIKKRYKVKGDSGC